MISELKSLLTTVLVYFYAKKNNVPIQWARGEFLQHYHFNDGIKHRHRYLLTIWIDPSKVLPDRNKEKFSLMPVSQIGAVLGSLEDLANFKSKKHNKRRWGEENLHFTMVRYQRLIESFKIAPEEFEIAVHPSSEKGMYAYVDGRHRGVISEKLAPGKPIRARVIITGRDFRRVSSWLKRGRVNPC